MREIVIDIHEEFLKAVVLQFNVVLEDMPAPTHRFAKSHHELGEVRDLHESGALFIKHDPTVTEVLELFFLHKRIDLLAGLFETFQDDSNKEVEED